jgi:hypothetical protein
VGIAWAFEARNYGGIESSAAWLSPAHSTGDGVFAAFAVRSHDAAVPPFYAAR